MQRIPAVLVFVVGLFQIVPVVGAFRANFNSLYGVEVVGSDMLILMRNRAVYIGATGALLLWSAFAPQLRLAAITLSLVCLGSYVVLTRLVGDYNDRLGQLAVVDMILVAALLTAAVAEVATRHEPAG